METPADIQAYFDTYIYNGDMALTQDICLGEFDGVSVWAYPQTKETDQNDDPIKEASNKVSTFSEEFAGKNVYIIGSDVVGTSSNFGGPEEIIKMGKPVNFKASLEAEAQANDSSEFLWESTEAFLEWYKAVVFEVGSTLGHISGVVILDAAQQQLYATQVELSHQVTEELHQHLKVLLDAGLGGAWQQIQQFLADSVELLGDSAADIIPTSPESEVVTEQLVFAHMVGVQVLAFLELLVGVQRDEVEKISLKNQVTNLIFDGNHS